MLFPDDVPTLTHGDVTLRAHRLDDADAIVEQCVDPVSVQWTTVPVGYTRSMAVEFAGSSVPEMWKSEKEFIFAIECTHPDGRRRFGGSLSLRDEGDRRAELAFGSHPAIRGQGVMTTAVNLLLNWGFKERGLETVIWLANEGNLGSRRVAWKAGFTFAGTARRWLSHRGEHLDAWLATIHKDDPREPTSAWFTPPVLKGERVVLRPLRDSDEARIVEGCSDERAQHWLPMLPSPYTEQDARDYLARVRLGHAEGKQVQWAATDPDSDVMLANVGLPRLHRTSAEIGYWSHPDARGRGVVTEAVSLALGFVFADTAEGGLGMHRAFIKAAAGNEASQHVARANGFTEFGRERLSEKTGDGSYGDMVCLDLLRDEWDAGRP